MANEFSGFDTGTGFYAVHSPEAADRPAVAVPEFGYYAGPAAVMLMLTAEARIGTGISRKESRKDRFAQV